MGNCNGAGGFKDAQPDRLVEQSTQNSRPVKVMSVSCLPHGEREREKEKEKEKKKEVRRR